jgi:hypothetical protein
MINYLEALLEYKTKNTNEHVLYNQWKLGKETISKKLQLIDYTFPNYTAHNASHSDSILNCLGNLFGREAFYEFSPEDIWLLLSAAYYHDSGMITKADEIERLLTNPDFIFFVKNRVDAPLFKGKKTSDYIEIVPHKEKTDDNHDVSSLERLCFKENIITKEKIDVFRELITEYIRKDHAKRSETFVEDNDALKASKGFLNDRLINHLCRVCKGHMEDFNDIMKISPSENGLGIHHFHPRFIACLIRIGDVLDMGNLRLAPELKTITSVCPDLSESHQKLQTSIQNYDLSPNGVRINFETNDIKVAKIAKDLMKLINNEFQNQALNWTLIKPAEYEKFPFIPTIKEVSVKLNDWDTFDERENNNIIVRSDRALDLLRGANIYPDKYQSIREIIQNAIDATLINIYVNKQNEKKIDYQNEGLYDNEIIEVKIDSKSNTKYFTVSVADYGYGMNKNDIKILTEIGSSKNNNERNKIIDKMPIWFKPSGTFGIGFQSIFLLTDKVTIYTRRANFGKLYKLEIYSPHCIQKGSFLIREISSESDCEYANRKIGTTVEFNVDYTELEHISYNYNEKNTQKFIYTFDPVYENRPKYQIGKILDRAINACKFSPIKTVISLDGKDIYTSKTEPFGSFFCPEKNIAIAFNFHKNPDNKVNIYYRNQPVERHNISIPFLPLTANILSSNAQDFLELNRESIRDEKEEILKKDIIYSSISVLLENWDNLPENVKYTTSIFIHHCLFIEYCKDTIFCNELKKLIKIPNIERYWMNVETDSITDENAKKTFSKDLNKIKRLCQKIIINYTEKKEKPIFDKENKTFTLSDDRYNSTIHDDYIVEFKKYFPYLCYNSIDKQKSIILSKDEEPIIIPVKCFYTWLKDCYCNISQTRGLMPCCKEFKALCVDDKKFGLYSKKYFTFSYFLQQPSYMICPIKLELGNHVYEVEKLVWDTDNLDLIRKIKECNTDSNISQDQIIAALNKFKSMYNDAVDKLNHELEEHKKNSNPYKFIFNT